MVNRAPAAFVANREPASDLQKPEGDRLHNQFSEGPGSWRVTGEPVGIEQLRRLVFLYSVSDDRFRDFNTYSFPI